MKDEAIHAYYTVQQNNHMGIWQRVRFSGNVSIYDANTHVIAHTGNEWYCYIAVSPDSTWYIADFDSVFASDRVLGWLANSDVNGQNVHYA